MNNIGLAVKGRSRMPVGIAPTARKVLQRLAIRGKNVVVGEGFRVGPGVIVSAPHELVIGRWVNVGPRSVIQVDGVIGDFCLIGIHVQILGRDDHALDEIGVPMSLSTWAGDREARPRDRIEISRDVWIGGSSVILSGIRLGEGAVVAAGSVVTRDVEPYTIVAGNPARAISQRFSNEDEREEHTRRLDELAQQGRNQERT
jgi:acetyltransferase-like isoleucine patch superfamily enzyme